MSINIISKSIVFNGFTNWLLVMLLMYMQFEIREEWFTLLLVLSAFGWSIYAGHASERYGQPAKVNGLVVGIGSISILLLVLFLFTSFSFRSLATNAFLYAVWMIIGHAGGAFGKRLAHNKHSAQQAL